MLSAPITDPASSTRLSNQGYANSDGIIFSSLGSNGINNYDANPLNPIPVYNHIPSLPMAINEQSSGLDQPNQSILPYPPILDPKQTDATTQKPYLINDSLPMEQSSDTVQVPDSSNNVYNFAGQLPFNMQTAPSTFFDQNKQQWQNVQGSLPSLSAISFTFAPLLAIPSQVSMTQSESHQSNKIPVVEQNPLYPNIGSYKQKTPNHCGVSNFTYSTRVVGGQVTENGKLSK